MMVRQRVETLNYPLGRSRQVSRTLISSWPRTMVLVLLMAIAVAGLCLIYLWQGTTILDLTAQGESERLRLTAIGEVNRGLEFEIGKAFSLERVSRLAQEQLHMVEPTNILYVRVPSTD